MPPPPRFCPRCGRSMPVEAGGAHGPSGITCTDPTCHYMWYPDPKVAVGVVVEDDAGRILLMRRNHPPRRGEWAFPSGYVDAGEVLEVAAVRETVEETGVQVRLDALLGAYSEAGEQVIFIAYAGSIIGGTPGAGDEAIEVAFFAPDDLPPLAFAHDGEVVTAWRAYRNRA